MGTTDPAPIPFPLSSFPGANPQESSGRLINAYGEPLGDPQKPTGPTPVVLRRSPGLSLQAITPQTGYRGGLIVNNLSFEIWANDASTVDVSGDVIDLGVVAGTDKISIARDQASPTPDVVVVTPSNGAYVLQAQAVVNASLIATLAGTSYTSGDTVALTFNNINITDLPETVTYTLGAGETPTTVATGLTTLINADAVLIANMITATSLAGVITIVQPGVIGNGTTVEETITGTGHETLIFTPETGQMGGGSGVFGVWTGSPTPYNGQGNLPQPNSVSFQDGYFFFTIGNGQVYASAINLLTQNALTFVTIQAKADVTLLRGIAYAGVMLFFTTGSCEVWQDAANPAPAFPYARMYVLEKGLIQSAAIAGFETGFSELMWVAQDFGVYWMTASSGLQFPVKVSPPDLDRLIEAQVRAGNTLEAGCYAFGGKKFWHLSSPAWTWEFNIATQKWK